MIVGIRRIKKPRRVRRCGNCSMSIFGEQIRLYGSAFSGERPSHLYLHPWLEARS